MLPRSFVLSFVVFSLFLFFVASGLCSLSHPCLSLANMAHSSSRSRTVPERSRSRDNPMWQNSWHYPPWPESPPAPRLRTVLAIVDLQSVRPLMNKTHDESMAATTCEVLPRLSRVEERALFTYNVLLTTHRYWKPSRCTTCCTASANISCTPGIVIYLCLPWTSGGKTTLETLSLFVRRTGL